MKIYEMDGEMRKAVYKRIRKESPQWKKLKGIYYVVWVLILIGAIATTFVVYKEVGAINSEFFLYFFLLVVCGVCFLPSVFNVAFKGILFKSIGEILVPETHQISLEPGKLISEWIPLPNQKNNVQGVRVFTELPYSEVTHIVWNNTFERLEIHGNYAQQVETLLLGWEPREHVHFTLNKNEKVLHLYAYFPQMQDIMRDLEMLTGCRIENKER